jgi:hypothetical protein
MTAGFFQQVLQNFPEAPLQANSVGSLPRNGEYISEKLCRVKETIQ